MGVTYQQTPSGGTVARVFCRESWSGYPGCVHGGLLASLMDGAMVHCLSARGVVAVTARLSIRYEGPVAVSRMATVEARLLNTRKGVHSLRARIEQDGRCCATAKADFVSIEGSEKGPEAWRPLLGEPKPD